jgi:hypothetical protein
MEDGLLSLVNVGDNGGATKAVGKLKIQALIGEGRL